MGSLDNIEETTDETTVENPWTPEQAAEAESIGWIPPERSQKMPEGKKFLGPQEFMERNPLYKQMQELKTNFNELNSHYQKVAVSEREKATKEFEGKIKDLESEKLVALDEADHARVIAIDKELRQTEAPKEDVYFDNWIKGNSWYNEDKFLSVEADKVAEIYGGKGIQGEELYNAVTDHIKQLYPAKFENKKRTEPSLVESGGNKPPSKPSLSATSFTSDEKIVYNNFKRMGIFDKKGSEAEYIKQVLELRE